MSIVFLYTSNEHIDAKIKNTILLTIVKKVILQYNYGKPYRTSIIKTRK